GTQGLLKDVAVKNVKAFEDHFLMEMENKHPDILAEFKKGVLNEESLKKMTELAAGLTAQYKA
ncbi:MAG: F0F1 ATP synthase subunit alpha, partial [Chitinophagaceae bacterium]|nr:F0F1 ATP synthase subunit alpha [Chitinophagaceae bacterium]